MKKGRKYFKTIRYLTMTTAVFLSISMTEKAHVTDSIYGMRVFSSAPIKCSIWNEGVTPCSGEMTTGLNYELLKRFAHDHKRDFSVIIIKDSSAIDSLYNGKTDILVLPETKVPTDEGFGKSIAIGNGYVWLVKDNGNPDNLKEINRWISHFTKTSVYDAIKDRFDNTANPYRLYKNGISVSHLSPYDDMIREKASDLGWDWRMLAAVIYQESKFEIASKSFRGASGLMQVMPATARYYKVDNLLDPESNMEAGTAHLKRLQSLYRNQDMSKEDRIKFTLASYNAGEGRIADCRNYAASKSENKNDWDTIVSLIPHMREDSILNEESVRLGKFKGYETIHYVDNIMDIYRIFCTICPES